MQLDDAQKQQVSTWIEEGASLSDVQNRLEQEFGIRLTYMDVRFLVGDLQLTPKDPEPPAAERPEEPVADASGSLNRLPPLAIRPRAHGRGAA